MSIGVCSMFPGFRFCPTDNELISYYLKNKLDGHHGTVQIISDVEICSFEPWDLPAKSLIGSDKEWFFFSPRGRKYPNGSQSKRATECGYWKATGKERNVKSGSNVIGTKRTLVFHLGRAPKGQRTEWMMHEYCINHNKFHQDSWVVCRLRKNREFRNLNDDGLNRGSSSQMPVVNSHAISEEAGDADQRGLCDHDIKRVTSSSKRSSSSFESPSVDQIDSAYESNHRPTPTYGATLTESSSYGKGVDEEDCYAEILKDDIIKLDESSLTQETCIGSLDLPHMQGTALRRIRLRHSSKHSSKPNFFAIIMTNRLVLFSFFLFTLVALFSHAFINLMVSNR